MILKDVTVEINGFVSVKRRGKYYNVPLRSAIAYGDFIGNHKDFEKRAHALIKSYIDNAKRLDRNWKPIKDKDDPMYIEGE